jgi:SecD/SecF fusion protein
MLYYSRWKSLFIWLVIAVSVIIALPNAIPDKTLSELPSWFPKHKITLGLDLQGGSHVMLQVDRNDIVKERLQSTVDDVRTKLREANVGYTGLAGTGQVVQVRVRDLSQLDAAKKALNTLTQPISAGTITGGSVVEATLTDAGDGLLKLNISRRKSSVAAWTNSARPSRPFSARVQTASSYRFRACRIRSA